MPWAPVGSLGGGRDKGKERDREREGGRER